MANDSNDVLSTMATLLVGGAAGYGASRWLVAPWLARRHHSSIVAAVSPISRRAAAPRPSPAAPTPAAYFGTSAPAPAASATKAKPLRVMSSTRFAPPDTALQTGPIKRPSQVDPSLVDSTAFIGGSSMSPPSFEGPPPLAFPIDPYADAPPEPVLPQPIGPPSGPVPIDPYAEPVMPHPLDPYGPGSAATQLTRTFDAVFQVYRGAIPIEYLRALAKRESDMNPRARTGAARGLLQVVPVVLADYNQRHGTRYEPQHLDDPAINVGIACELLHIIIASYHRNHPRVRNLQADWANLRFVELLTFGWNTGFSEAGGLGRVTRYLEQYERADDITIDVVHRAAREAGASKHLTNPAKVRWCKSVAALYAREREATDRDGAAPIALARSMPNPY